MQIEAVAPWYAACLLLSMAAIQRRRVPAILWRMAYLVAGVAVMAYRISTKRHVLNSSVA